MHNRLKIRVVMASVICGLGVMGSIFNVSAASSSWLESEIFFNKESELAPGTQLPSSFNGNRDCINHKFITRPAKLLPELSYQACGVETRFGIVDSNGRVELNNTNVAGNLVNHPDFGSRPGLLPIPGSSTVINAQSAPSGVYLYFTKDVYPSLTTTVLATGEITYKINKPFDARLRDKSNKLMQVHTDSLSFSSNGKWMVVDSPNLTMLRVNLETFEVLPFAPSFNYSIGLAPGIQTAISADGRYAMVASNIFPTFKIYDLDTCGSVPSNITGPVNCQSRDLLAVTKLRVPNYLGLSMVRFINGDLASAYLTYQLTPGVTSTNRTAKYLLGTSTDISQRLDYLALGDSYISGEGAYEYRDGTDIDNNKCHISQRSYPYLISDQLNYSGFKSVACSGAVIEDVINIVIPESNGKKSQAQGKNEPIYNNEIYSNFLPGYRAQLKFVTQNRPKIVTVSIGGNDIGFSDIIERCLAPDSCYSTYEDRLELVRLINRKYVALKDNYSKIKNNTSADSKIYVIGYPQIAKPNGSCAVNVRLNAAELEFARLLISYLNSVIKISADEAGVRYVDAEDALVGYRLCETESFDVAVNGLTLGNDIPNVLNGPIGQESYHPNAWGHTLLKNKILEATQNLTLGMPAPVTSPLLQESDLEILNAPKTGRSVSKVNFDDDLSNDVVYRENLLSIAVEGLKYALKPLSPFQAWLNSEPVLLATSTSDGSGDLSFTNLSIPQNVPPGFHSLHIKGQNIAGESIDIFKTVYVAAERNDLDGDVINNSIDACVLVEPAGSDKDKDGIDDGCDGFIDKSSAVTLSAQGNPATQASAGTKAIVSASNHARPLTVSANTAPTGADSGTDQDDIAFVPEAGLAGPKPQQGVVLGASISRVEPWKWGLGVRVAAVFAIAGVVLWMVRRLRIRG